MTEPLLARRRVPHGSGARVVRTRLGFGGAVGAILLFCLSLTPSLLPRHWSLQAVVSGITMAIGYGLGATIGVVGRSIWRRLPAASKHPVGGRNLRRASWWILGGAGSVLAAISLGLGESWQREVRRLVDAGPETAWYPVPIAAVAVAVFGLLLLAARGIRLATRRLASTLGRFSPRPVASVAAVGVVAVLSYGLGQGVVFNGFVDVAERGAAAANAAIPDGVSRPGSPYVSGGPGSLVSWDSLGAHGRKFTAGVVPRSTLVAFSGGYAEEPIRVYVGRDSAPDLAAQADLAVRELARTGAFDRAVLAVITTTGTGWVNPAVPEALEYMYAGDSAVVAMQYSYLPSWISFMADRQAATEAATTLIGAVRDRLAAIPAGDRPELVVYGESLGAHGTEAAFGDLDELLAETDGALLAGPPHTNPIWREVVDERDPDSPVWQPVYEGGDAVRFVQDADDLSAEAGDRPRVVYLQNASDPIVWWSPELLYEKPAWLDGSRGPDVSGAMQWFPVVTFWQITVDLITSTKAPSGHGHSYHESVADGWAALLAPPGWTDADTARLRPLLSPES